MFHIILETIPRDKLGIYNGIASMIISFAPALGPTYGGVMTLFLSWRMIFDFIIPILILLFVLGFYSIRIKTIYRHRQFDWLGLVLLAGVFADFVEAFNQAGQHGFSSKAFIALPGLASAMTLLMIMHIRYGKFQLLNFAI